MKGIKGFQKGNTFGRRFTSESQKGRPAWNKGRVGIYSNATIQKMRASLTGRKLEEAHRLKIVAALHKRGSPSTETRQKISAAQRGAKSVHWKGGLTTLDKLIRKSIEYHEWRDTVFNRDDYTCQSCRIRGGQLNADHIEAFAILLRKHGITDVQAALICTDLWDIANGRTLCLECHQKTDNYGYKVVKSYTA